MASTTLPMISPVSFPLIKRTMLFYLSVPLLSALFAMNIRFLLALCLKYCLPMPLGTFICVILFAINSTLFEINIIITTFLYLLFAWYIFFHPFTFSLPVSSYLNLLSYRYHIIGSCFINPSKISAFTDLIYEGSSLVTRAPSKGPTS